MAYEPNAKLVMALRQKTGAGLMDCKKALIAAEGDEKAAIDWLREKGIASGAKKEGRVAAEGNAYVASKNGKTVLVEVNCETDFVARGEAFKEYVGKVADYILDNPTVKVEDIANNIADVTSEYTLKMGEKLSVRRYSIFDSKDGVINSYVHMGGTIGTIVLLSKGTSDEVAHEIALHVTVSSPKYISANEVPQDEIEHEKQILTAQAQAEPNPKPLNIIEKMVQGRINKYYKEVCLNDQVKYDDSDVTIAQYLKQNGGAEVLAFVRYKMGEGIEKKKDDAVDEIAESLKKAGL